MREIFKKREEDDLISFGRVCAAFVVDAMMNYSTHIVIKKNSISSSSISCMNRFKK